MKIVQKHNYMNEEAKSNREVKSEKTSLAV